MCVLAPNALTEKIFVILWFWYGLLALITGLNLLLIISMVFPSAFIRKWYLARAVHSKKVHTCIIFTPFSGLRANGTHKN